MAYLDLDQLLDPVHDDEMLVARRGLANQDLVAGSDPAAVVVVDERFGRRLLVVEVAEHDRGGLHEELAGLVVLGDLLARDRVDDLGFAHGDERARGAKVDVIFAGGADDGGRLGHA